MYRIMPESQGRAVGVQVSGTLTKADYGELVPFLEERIRQEGGLCILFEMHDFEGWKPGALWADVKFDVKHNRAIQRAALVGEAAWEKWMTRLMVPFAHAETRYFDRARHDEAWAWIRECSTPSP